MHLRIILVFYDILLISTYMIHNLILLEGTLRYVCLFEFELVIGLGLERLFIFIGFILFVAVCLCIFAKHIPLMILLLAGGC